MILSCTVLLQVGTTFDYQMSLKFLFSINQLPSELPIVFSSWTNLNIWLCTVGWYSFVFLIRCNVIFLQIVIWINKVQIKPSVIGLWWKIVHRCRRTFNLHQAYAIWLKQKPVAVHRTIAHPKQMQTSKMTCWIPKSAQHCICLWQLGQGSASLWSHFTPMTPYRL